MSFGCVRRELGHAGLWLMMLEPLLFQLGDSAVAQPRPDLQTSSKIRTSPKTSSKLQTATALNTAGFRAYRAQNYEDALTKFQQAVEVDPRYALAHYNLACTLAVLRAAGRVCDFDAYQATILDHLEKAVKLDPRRLERMKSDPDLKPIRGTLRYQLLLGLKLDRPSDFKKILLAITWYGERIGAAPVGGIEFHDQGEATLWEPNLDDITRRLERRATYVIDGLRVRLRVVSESGKVSEHIGTIDKTGTLRFKGLAPYSDDPQDCDA